METTNQPDLIRALDDVNFSLDRNTFHTIQTRCMERGISINLGVLQLVDYYMNCI